MVEAESDDRIVVHRAAPDLDAALRIFNGLYEPGYLERLRSEENRADAHHRAASTAFARFADQQVELLLCTVNYAEALVRPAEDERTCASG